jgi:cysteine desulfurase
MANISPSVLRQASRLATKSSIATSSRQSVGRLSRVATVPLSRASTRSYVTESKRDNAQVAEAKIETAVRLDKKAFEKAGLSLNAQDDSRAVVSPMAGKFFFFQ